MVLFYFEWSALLMLDQEKQEEVIPQQVPCRRQTLADLIHHFPIHFKVHKYYLWFILFFKIFWKVLQWNTTNFCGHLKISHLWTQMFNIWCHHVVFVAGTESPVGSPGFNTSNINAAAAAVGAHFSFSTVRK